MSREAHESFVMRQHQANRTVDADGSDTDTGALNGATLSCEFLCMAKKDSEIAMVGIIPNFVG